MSKKRKIKALLWKLFYMLFNGAVGICTGVCAIIYLRSTFADIFDSSAGLLLIIGLFLGVYMASYLQVIIHESGHLVFGLMSGYRFGSFRIASFIWVKDQGKIKFKRMKIAGTGGQCLMSPPKMVDGKFPVVLYNFGGALMNLIFAALFIGLFFAFKSIPILSAAMFICALMGIALALTNGVPMRNGTIDNDGYNACALSRNPAAMRALWVQLKVNESISKGIRLKDMPDEWFEVPSDEAMQNSMVTAQGVFACNRLMDEERFAEADELMAHLLSIDSGMAGLHRYLLICDRMYIELTGENRREVIDAMLSKEQKKFMKQMGGFLTVIRTEYVYALLYEKNIDKAAKIKEQFEKRAKSYPYQVDVITERELIERAEKIADEVCELDAEASK